MTGLIVGIIAGAAIGALTVPIARDLYHSETARGWRHAPRLTYAVTGGAIGAVVIVGTIGVIVFVVGLVVI